MTSAKSAFKRRALSPERVVLAEAAAAGAPIVGDIRLGAASAAAPVAEPDGHDVQKPSLPQASQTPTAPQVGSSQATPAAQRYVIGQTYEVPTHEVVSNPVGPRGFYTNSDIDEMAMTLTENDQRMAATGYFDEEKGQIVLIEGETRLRGSRASSRPTLRVEIRPKPASMRQLYEEARGANVERRAQTPLDDAVKWKELLATKVYGSQKEIAESLKLGADTVSRTISIAEMPHRLLVLLSEHRELLTLRMLTSIREFWEAAGDDRDEKTLELIREAAHKNLGYRDIIKMREKLQAGPVSRKRSSRDDVFFMGVKGEVKSFAEDGRVELSLKGLKPEAQEEAVAKIKALFAPPAAA